MGVEVSTEPTIRILTGHVLDVLPTLKDESVQCVVTSPPYHWGLRDYSKCGCTTGSGKSGGNADAGDWQPHRGSRGVGGETEKNFRAGSPSPNCPKCHGTGTDESLNVIWDAKDGCDHEFVLKETEAEASENVRWQHTTGGGMQNRFQNEGRSADEDREFTKVLQGFCRRCGAWKGQLGLEPTPELYVRNIVQAFRAVWRVLRRDGVLWVNMGDCYASSPPGNRGDFSSSGLHRDGRPTPMTDRYRDTLRNSVQQKMNTAVGVLKAKDLVGMPWRVAFALQDDGWWLRSDIIGNGWSGGP